MTIAKQEQRPPRSPCGRRLTLLEAGGILAVEQIQELWAAYRTDRGNLRLRNRLVEHYLPWVGELAASLAKKMRFRDRENAVGEVLAALVESIVPRYDGKSGFHRWAYACTKRKLLDVRRAEQRACGIFADLPAGASKLAALDRAPDRGHSGGDREFGQLTAELNDRQAVVLWLRGYCGLSVAAVAPLLKISPRSVEAWTRSALAALQEK